MTGFPSLWLKGWRRLAAGRKVPELSSLAVTAMPAALRLGGAFLQLLSTILIARSLGVKDSGIYFFWAVAMMEVGQVATYGLDRLALQQVPRLDGKKGALTSFLAPLRASALMVAVVLSSGLCAYALLVQSDPDRNPLWFLLPFLCVSGVVMSMINGEAMAGLGRPVLAIFCRHTMLNVTLIASILILGDRLTADLAIAAYAMAFFLSGFGAFLLPGFRGQGAPLRLPSRSQFREFLAKGTPLFLGGLFASLAFVVPLGILERTRSSEEIALLTTGFRIFVLVDVLAKAIHSLVMPELSRAAHAGDGVAMSRIYRVAIVKGLGVLGVPIIGLVLFAQSAMEIFGEGFGEGASLLRIFMVFSLISLILGPAHQLLLMVGQTHRMALFSLIQLLFSVALGLMLVPTYGPVVLALILSGCILLEKVLYLASARRAMRESGEQKGGGDGSLP